MVSYSGSKVEKLMAGDQEVYWELFDTYYEQHLRYALNALKSTSLAESVLEQVFELLWEQRTLLDSTLTLEHQLSEIVEHKVFEVLRSVNANSSLREAIWEAIRNTQNLEDDLLLPVERNSVLKVIHNNILQQQLLHQLATTRR